MGKLVHSSIASLDGYVNDEGGSFDWAAPDEELHAFVNDLVRPAEVHLCGRRMYEVMQYWETAGGPEDPPVIQDFARMWRASDKIVVSRSLGAVTTARTTLVESFDPQAVARLKDASSMVTIGGPTLAAEAYRAGLVDEVQIVFVPYVAGGGTAALPKGWQGRLDLLEERRFTSGAVFLRYEVVPA